MKVDLHLHTPSSEINGDSINWVSELDSIKKMYSNKIGSFAFTDHNVFNAKRYLMAKKIASTKLFAFPGVEISILKESGIIAHLIVLFDNTLSHDELVDIEEITRVNLRKKGIKISKVYEIYNKYKIIAIPHVGKGDYFKIDELDFIHDAIETTSYENSNYKRWKKMLNNKSVVAFSDTHIWRDYPQNEKLETFIEFDGTFDDLKKQLNQNKNYTKEK